MTTPDRFFEALRGLQRQTKRFAAPSEEVLQEFRRVTESLALADAASIVDKGKIYYAYPAWRVTDLLSWWPLDTLSQARDVHGAYNGSFAGNAAVSSEGDLALGRVREYVTLDGAGDYVSLGDITQITGATAALTVGARVYVTSLASQRAIVCRLTGLGEYQFSLEVGTNGRLISAHADGERGETGAGVIAANTWYSVMWVFNGGGGTDAQKVQLYVNGISQSLNFPGPPQTTLVKDSSLPVLIGRRNSGPLNDFAGRISDVAVWQASLSGSEALAYHNDSVSDRIMAGEFVAG